MGFNYIIEKNNIQIVNGIDCISLSHEKFKQIQYDLKQFEEKECPDPPGFEFGG